MWWAPPQLSRIPILSIGSAGTRRYQSPPASQRWKLPRAKTCRRLRRCRVASGQRSLRWESCAGRSPQEVLQEQCSLDHFLAGGAHTLVGLWRQEKSLWQRKAEDARWWLQSRLQSTQQMVEQRCLCFLSDEKAASAYTGWLWHARQ